MLNPFKDVNWNPDLTARRKFAVSLIIGFPIVAAVLATITRLGTQAWKPGFIWLAVIGLTVGVVLWLLPQIARPFYVAWYFLGCCMGFVVGNVLFSAFYYLVITPIGLAMRLGGRDPLGRRFKRGAATYWRDAEKGIDPARYYRQF